MPLVSVIIASYNSSSFIIETLESVAKQTWRDIELIIADDCSVDNTVEVCSTWLKAKGQRFINAALIESEINTGVTANANRGLGIARGEWIKLLGADDTLRPDCINENMSWISTHSEVRALFSHIEVYKNTFEQQNLIETTPHHPYGSNSIMARDRSADSQYKMLLISDRIHFTPSVFLHRETLLSVGGLDERFRLLEDYPLWLNLTGKGHKLYFMDKVTVNYRRHANAINNSGDSILINPNYFKLEKFRRIYTYPFLPLDIRLLQRYTYYSSYIFRFEWLNNYNKPNRFILSILTIYLNPFKYFIWLRKTFDKSLKNNEFYK